MKFRIFITNLLFLCFLSSGFLFSQTYTISNTINWANDHRTSQSNNITYPTFEGASYNSKKHPVYFLKKSISSPSYSYEIYNQKVEIYSGGNEIKKELSNNFSSSTYVTYHQGNPSFNLVMGTLRINSSGQIERLKSFDVKITCQQPPQKKRSHRPVSNSVLSSGQWFKIALSKDGVYKINATFLKNLGIDLSSINPRNIKIFGNGGGMLPLKNSDFRNEDLQENSILVSGEEDGVFNENDYVLFYGQSQHRWKRDSLNNYTHINNIYSDTTYYFLTISSNLGKRILQQNSDINPLTKTVKSFDDYVFHESDKVNLLHSGQEWFGELFDSQTSYSFSVSFPNIDNTTPFRFTSNVAARAGNPSSFNIAVNNNSLVQTVSQVNIEDYLGSIASQSVNTSFFTPQGDNINIQYSFQKPDPSAQGWLDYFEVQARRNLIMNGSQMIFRDGNSVASAAISEFQLGNFNSGNSFIWDVTDPLNVKLQNYTLSGSTAIFRLPTPLLKEFICFNDFLTPKAMGEISNQNLHGLSAIDMAIVAYPDFLSAANQLADFHRQHDGMKVEVVTPNQIYNEFSSGAQDIIAIRDFMRSFTQKTTDTTQWPRYLLLFGDASYDFKNRVSSNTNFIPTYESTYSLDHVGQSGSFASDDFFGLLDNTEGNLENDTTELDLGIGRLPVRSLSEANDVVNKILNYSSSLGDWRNVITLVADDRDESDSEENTFAKGSEVLDKIIRTKNPKFNVEKIYLDAYKEVSSAGGTRYPTANEALNQRIERGSWIINYVGHGAPTAWAHERVITLTDIDNWSNSNKLPIFMTATCEFSRFDDPSLTSAGELVLLNPGGGGIALLTTVRVVYQGENQRLNESFYNSLLANEGKKDFKLGDIFMITKNNTFSLGSNNTFNFTLLGDPALQLNFGVHNISTTSINNMDVITDTAKIKALEKVTIEGNISEFSNGSLVSNFNGVLYPTIYDKEDSVITLGNGTTNEKFIFPLQKNVLYKGKASIKDGKFAFSFIVPKDIAYRVGKGKISYYAENGSSDAGGAFTKFLIGGSSGNLTDKTGPDTKVFLNDKKFVFGGLTDENPKLIISLEDENGINTVGNGIGHDISAILDDNNNQPYILNDFYESDLDSYQKGQVIYPFKKLKEGNHKLKIKVWDVANNSSEAYTEFVVASSAKLALSHVLNYPNPFTTHTSFYFEHNKPGIPLQIQVQIFTISGKLIKTINVGMTTSGYRSDAIEWNGRDEYGDNIGRGVYIYRLKIKDEQGMMNDKYEKLVILN